MKISLLFIAILLVFSTFSFAGENKFQCIADRLQAVDSRVYSNLSESDVYTMLTISEMTGHLDATNVQKFCESESEYKCVAERLQAINSDIYSDLAESDVYSMLTIPEMFGHNDAINALKFCRK